MLNSSDIKSMVNIKYLSLRYLPSTIINSADFVDWNPATGFYLYSLTSASITLDTAHMARVESWHILPLLHAKRLRHHHPQHHKKLVCRNHIRFLPTGKFTQAQCDLILWDVYQIARTKTGGTIQLNYPGNAAPSGTFQACQSCPVICNTGQGNRTRTAE